MSDFDAPLLISWRAADHEPRVAHPRSPVAVNLMAVMEEAWADSPATQRLICGMLGIDLAERRRRV